MKTKKIVLKKLIPIAYFSKPLKILAVIQFVITLLTPVFIGQLDTGLWLISLALFGFWLASAAVLDLAKNYTEDRNGIQGWFKNSWENLIFVLWFAVVSALLLFAIKLLFFMQSS